MGVADRTHRRPQDGGHDHIASEIGTRVGASADPEECLGERFREAGLDERAWVAPAPGTMATPDGVGHAGAACAGRVRERVVCASVRWESLVRGGPGLGVTDTS